MLRAHPGSSAPPSVSKQLLRLLVVDDHDLFRAGLRALLSQVDGVAIIAEAQDERSALAALTPQVDVSLVDVRLRGPNGIALVRELRRRGIATPVLMLTMCDDREFVLDAFAAGANGYALKTTHGAELAQAVRAVHAGERYLSPELRRIAGELDRGTAPDGVLATMSAREREIFELLVNGASNKEIAAQLFIRVKTVETHRTRIFNKLNVNSMGELVRLAARHHLLDGA